MPWPVGDRSAHFYPPALAGRAAQPNQYGAHLRLVPVVHWVVRQADRGSLGGSDRGDPNALKRMPAELAPDDTLQAYCGYVSAWLLESAGGKTWLSQVSIALVE
jgi:hypothetical protein